MPDRRRFTGSGSWWWPGRVLGIWWRSVTPRSAGRRRRHRACPARPVCESDRLERIARRPHGRLDPPGRRDGHAPGTGVRGGGQQPLRGPSWAATAAPWPARSAGSVPLVPRHRTWVIVRGLGASPVAPGWPSAAWRARGPRRGVHRPTRRRVAIAPRRRPVRRVTEPEPVRVSTGAPGQSSRLGTPAGTGGCTAGRTAMVVPPPAGRTGVVTSEEAWPWAGGSAAGSRPVGGSVVLRDP
jgi:hypothetical protein